MYTNVCFLLSVSLNQYSILIISLIQPLNTKTRTRCLGTFKKSTVVTDIGEH